MIVISFTVLCLSELLHVVMVTVLSATAGGCVECTEGEGCVSGSHVLQELLQASVQFKQKFSKSEYLCNLSMTDTLTFLLLQKILR